MTKKRCELCPEKLKTNSPSPEAMERLHDAYSDESGCGGKVGCDWMIISAEHNYCFWSYAKTLDTPIPDKEICSLLGISKKTLKDLTTSALEKLKSDENKEMIDLLDEVTQRSVDEVNSDEVLPHSFVNSIFETSNEETVDDESEKKIPKKKPGNLVMHRDGKKVDIFGLSKNKKVKK